MLRLLADPTVTTCAARVRRCAPRPGVRRPRVVPPLERPARIVRIVRRDAPLRAPGPPTDDPSARRRELAELGRLAMAYAMREGLAR